MDKESAKKNRPVFRFLKPHEFAALSQDEKAAYLQQAIEAVTRGDPLDDMPVKERH